MKLSVFYEHILEAAAQEHKPVEKILKKVVSYGISGIEIEDKRLKENKEELLSMIKKAGLEFSCMYGFFDFGHEKKLDEAFLFVDLAEETGIRKVMLLPGFLSKEEFQSGYEEKIDQMVEALHEVCEYAWEKKIMVVLEDFDGAEAPYANSGQLLYFLDRIEKLYCAFDTGNFLFSEEDAYEVLPMFLSRIGHVHCKDRTFKASGREEPKATIEGRNMYSCAVGSGCIPMKKIMQSIRESGYQDYFAIEHFGSLHQLRDMKRSAKWLKALDKTQ